MKNNVCCFIGHRTIDETEELKQRLNAVIKELIENKRVGTFLFGSKSRFNDLCYGLITELKENYPHIRRVYVRAEYPVISEEYKEYLLTAYEDTYFPERALKAGRAVYAERNFEMIQKSDFCVMYYSGQSRRNDRKSGTGIAYDYAVRHKKSIVNLAENS